MRYLVVNDQNWVVNVIVWDGESPYDPEGKTLLPCSDHQGVTFGWHMEDGKWIAPPPPPEPEPEV